MATTIQEYSQTEAALIELKEKYSIVPDVTTKAGYKLCKENAKIVGSYRINLEKKRKEIKGPALEKCKAIDAEAKRITAELSALENPLKEAYKVIDDEKKRLDELRIKGIQDKIVGMVVFIDMARDGGDSEEIAEWIEQVSDIDCSNGFDEFTKEALVQKNKTLESLQNYMESAINREIEAKKLADECEKLEQEKAEQAEKEAARLLIQIENDHEFGLMMNEKFDFEKDKQLKVDADNAAKKQAELKSQQEEREKQIAENVRLAEVKRQEDAVKAEEERVAKFYEDEKNLRRVRSEIKNELISLTGIDSGLAAKVCQALTKMDRITISYE